MAFTLRIATFNVENLFSRAKVLNLRDHTVTEDALQQVGELQKLLKKSTYSAAVKKDIVHLYDTLKTYIDVREDRGKLFSKKKDKVVASGASDWDGEVVFRRAKFSEVARENTAKVIKAVKADVACIVEAEDRPTLLTFNGDMMDSKKFKYAMLIDGNDPRGIDVGTFTNFDIVELKTHIYDGPSNSRTFSRDCLRVEMELPNGKKLHILCNHFKSKSGGEAATDPRRERQATRVAEILAEYKLTTDLVVVAGDFNDTPTRAPLQPLLGVTNLHDVLALQFPSNPAARWTYHYQNTQQIDYLLVSKPLKDAFVAAGVERRGIYGLSKITGGAEHEFPTVTRPSEAASDHGAVWAEFSL